ncbi:hypothetical protein PR048_017081 [Dryococelus australis]|uniref:Uncharacterized protein n=1 Tax=Dryococelus australis TaxID=614101 RepID=A0ABQ9H8P4_9NEOP|nr:hypothetical protein PR048_017081 [Dryococelus australis]
MCAKLLFQRVRRQGTSILYLTQPQTMHLYHSRATIAGVYSVVRERTPYSCRSLNLVGVHAVCVNILAVTFLRQ